MMLRCLAGLAAGALGGLVAGPVGAYAGWKVAGFATTGNPLHLIPGGALASDAASLVADFGLSEVLASVGDPPTDVWQHGPTDVQGNDPRRDIFLNPPTDIYGRPL